MSYIRRFKLFKKGYKKRLDNLSSLFLYQNVSYFTVISNSKTKSVFGGIGPAPLSP